jgi:NAD(P)-dependent dehydrogenase (short-subunit alcohol dehydrogenase family)
VSDAGLPETLDGWRTFTQAHVKSLFQILNAYGRRRVRSEGNYPKLLTASSMGGNFGRDGRIDRGLPTGGGGLGLIKSLAMEWSGAVAKAVDFDLRLRPADIAELLVAELLNEEDPHVEIGYPGGTRTVFGYQKRPHAPAQFSTAEQPSSEWVVLATGGARGITAEILTEFVKPDMMVIIVGKSPLPQANVAEFDVSDPAVLRSRMIAEANRNGEPIIPARLEADVQALINDRERCRTLSRLAEAGVRVVYRECDVRNSDQVLALAEWIQTTYGRLDAVFHGAGIIEDKLLVDKADASFDRVFDTKADAAFLLSRYLAWDKVKLAVLFGSVSGRVGNPGQTDYAAANEVLNRMAWWLHSQSPHTRIICIDWGPWASSGMATAPTLARLHARGIEPITSEEGRKFFAREIAHGRLEDVEVLAGEGPWIELVQHHSLSSRPGIAIAARR